jgi:tetratricopeptide (TPR) repeat protein
MRITIGILIWTLCICTSAAAQHEHGGALIGGHVPREIIERPVPIRTGIGNVQHPTSTKSPEAQGFYEQGLAYLHSYVWLEAARSFNQALRTDQNFALAWVGLSRAYSGLEDPKAAGEAQEKAKALAEGVTPREQRWIRARSLQVESMSDRQNGNKRIAYVAALDEALEHDPQDGELWTLRGNAEEPGGASGRGQRGGASSIVFYHEAIRRVPGHFGAHHYLIHSYEMVGLFDEALKHGAVYSAAASRIPHALHMYGHDLMKTGQIDKAIDIFGRARKLEHDYYEHEKILRDYDWHHTHNTALLALSHRHMGQVVEAQRLLDDAASVGQGSGGRGGSYYRGLVADLLVARGQYERALEIAKGLTSGGGRSLGNAIAARALVAQGKMDEARKHLADLPGGVEGTDKGGSIEVDLARGEFLLRTGQREAGTKILAPLLARARRQRTPDGWIEGLFTLETVFHIGRAAGDWDLAGKAAALLIEHDKAYGGSQYAAALVAEHEGKTADAKRGFAEASRLWKNADAEYAPVRELRGR